MWGRNCAAHDALQSAAVLADERDLAHGGEVEVQRLQQMPERLPDTAARSSCSSRSWPTARLLVAALAGQRGEAQQPERRS